MRRVTSGVSGGFEAVVEERVIWPGGVVARSWSMIVLEL
jgi:hypothetical protein